MQIDGLAFVGLSNLVELDLALNELFEVSRKMERPIAQQLLDFGPKKISGLSLDDICFMTLYVELTNSTFFLSRTHFLKPRRHKLMDDIGERRYKKRLTVKKHYSYTIISSL